MEWPSMPSTLLANFGFSVLVIFWSAIRAISAQLRLIDPRFVTSNDAFDECRVFSFFVKPLLCVIYLRSFLQNIQAFWYQSNIHMLYTTKIILNVLSQSIRVVEILRYPFDTSTTVLDTIS